mmetsp:Transcript_16265/g.46429  ORF Transcript_16265/g.46429 Transcript_16265/m.46429 type:complete len:482 (-) Transcript_16265:42-1487(-)
MTVLAGNPPGTVVYAKVVDVSCSACFAVEVALRAIADTTVPLWKHGWLVMDVIILIADMIASVIRPLLGELGTTLDVRVLSALTTLRLMRLIRLWKVVNVSRPLIIIFRAIRGLWLQVISAIIFVGLVCLTFSVWLTPLVGKQLDEDNPELREAQEYFSSIPRALLTQMESTVGGLAWGESIVRPFMAAGGSWTVFGCVIVATTFLSTFWVWNLVLGIFVKQVTDIANFYDREVEQSTLCDTKKQIQLLRDRLVTVTDNDGYVRREDMNDVLEDDDLLQTLGLQKEDFDKLFVSLATDSGHQVQLNEILFGVMRFKSQSKTVDILNIDFKQKVFCREITQIAAVSSKALEHVSGDLDTLCEAAKELEFNMAMLLENVEKAKDVFRAQLAEEERQHKKYSAHVKRVTETKRAVRNQRAREKIESHLQSLRGQAEELMQARQWECLKSNEIDRSALRRAVSERLDTQLKPWWQKELAEAGMLD